MDSYSEILLVVDSELLMGRRMEYLSMDERWEEMSARGCI
jgi:hypothetical protein